MRRERRWRREEMGREVDEDVGGMRKEWSEGKEWR